MKEKRKGKAEREGRRERKRQRRKRRERETRAENVGPEIVLIHIDQQLSTCGLWPLWVCVTSRYPAYQIVTL